MLGCLSFALTIRQTVSQEQDVRVGDSAEAAGARDQNQNCLALAEEDLCRVCAIDRVQRRKISCIGQAPCRTRGNIAPVASAGRQEGAREAACLVINVKHGRHLSNPSEPRSAILAANTLAAPEEPSWDGRGAKEAATSA